jgi:hypothetical protein
MEIKAGDRFVLLDRWTYQKIGNVVLDSSVGIYSSIQYTYIPISSNRCSHGFVSYTNFTEDVKDGLLVPEEIYNSPVRKALRELHGRN